MYTSICCTDYNVIPVTRTVYGMTVQHISYFITIKVKYFLRNLLITKTCNLYTVIYSYNSISQYTLVKTHHTLI